MSTKYQSQKDKALNEKGQAILARLLKDDDNKYCVDCDQPGPRWASWNLGIFLCIRCAGIHRNLGAHISKVKSVNLDTWTPEQISMMMEIGNSRARAVYEANIPDGFRRPRNDSSLEPFIRSKYEQKKYIAREWVPPIPRVPREFLEDDIKDKKKVRRPPGSMVQLNSSDTTLKPSERVVNGEIKTSGSAPSKLSEMNKEKDKVPVVKPVSSSIDDLLGLDSPESKPTSLSTANFLGEIMNQPAPITASSATPNTTPTEPEAKDTEEPCFDDPTQSKTTKDSIMALFGQSNNQSPYGAYMGMNPQAIQMNAQYSPYQMNNPPMNVSPQVPVGLTQGNIGMNPAMNQGVNVNQMGPVYGMQGMANVPMQMQPGYGQMQGMYATPAANQAYQNVALQQQQHLQQIQQQMSRLNVGPSPQVGQMNSQPWQPSPSTLSNNLWQ